MANKPTPIKEDLHDYAGGWITERKGTEVPAFLRFVYIFVASGTIVYLLYFIYGETTHDDRGVFVREFNRVTGTSEGLMYFIGALAAVFFIFLVAFAFRRENEADHAKD